MPACLPYLPPHTASLAAQPPCKPPFVNSVHELVSTAILPLLTHTGYRERFVDDCCIPLANGKEVCIKQAPSAKQFRQQGATQQHKQRHGDRSHLDKQSDPALTGST